MCVAIMYNSALQPREIQFIYPLMLKNKDNIKMGHR